MEKHNSVVFSLDNHIATLFIQRTYNSSVIDERKDTRVREREFYMIDESIM